MNYSKYNKIAKEKIAKYGSPLTVSRVTSEVYDESTDTYNSVVTTEITGYGIVNNFNEKDIDGTNILAGDVMIMCWLPQEPLVEDKIEIGSKTYTCISVSELNVNGVDNIYYKLQGRQ